MAKKQRKCDDPFQRESISSLRATILLIVFAFVVGTLIMTFIKDNVMLIPEDEYAVESINPCNNEFNEPLKVMIVKYLKDEISKKDLLNACNKYKE